MPITVLDPPPEVKDGSPNDQSGAADESRRSPYFTLAGGPGTVSAMNRDTSLIRLDDELVTLIGVFDVEPSKQEQLVELLTEGTDRVMQHRPGFVSVNILASNDGTRVVNYAQWRDYDSVRATMDDPDVQGYARRASELAQATPHVYSVVSIHHA
jgi:quinol monooxygenase YgiN